MGFIPGLDDYSTTYQVVGLVIVVCVALLTIVGMLICCCRQETTADSVRTVGKQNKKFAPTKGEGDGSGPNTFSALVLAVPRWSALLAASHMHACGADYRLKHVIANAALKHGAYYVAEGDNSNATINRKLVVAKHPKALVDVIDEVFSKAMMLEFSNNMAANELLHGAYSGPSCWPGLQLLAALHTGEGTCCAPPTDDGATAVGDVPYICHGAVVDDTTFLAEHFEQNDGHAIVSATFLKALGKHAPSEKDRRLQDLVEAADASQHRRGSALPSSGPFKKWAFGAHSTTRVAMPTSSRGSSAKSTPLPSEKRQTNNYVEDAVMQKIQHKRRHSHVGQEQTTPQQDVEVCDDVMDF